MHWVLLHTKTKLVTRGYNIVADERAGASNPHPHPYPHPSDSNIQKKYLKKFVFPTFWLDHHEKTDRRTKGPTDKASYRAACPQLNSDKKDKKENQSSMKQRNRETNNNILAVPLLKFLWHKSFKDCFSTAKCHELNIQIHLLINSS